MSLWWMKKEQLDEYQLDLIENLPLAGHHLIVGPPGSGKTNVLLRRAQFVRGQQLSNVIVLTFTRALTEFTKTGCLDAEGREIFPRDCVTTLESWIRGLYSQHGRPRPQGKQGMQNNQDLREHKIALAGGALDLASQNLRPMYDAIFVDEAQDLLPEEVELIAQWSGCLLFVGDSRQKIHHPTSGLLEVRKIIPEGNEKRLPYHYRLAPELCQVADRILLPEGGASLVATSRYDGPRPGNVLTHGPLSKDAQVQVCAARLRDQVRVYGDLIQQGDRLGVVVASKSDRDSVCAQLNAYPALQGKVKVIRSAGGGDDPDDSYDPSFDPEVPICILTIQASKGIEFRAVHWLFSETYDYYHDEYHYYTIVTRAKTEIDIYFAKALPEQISRAHSPAGVLKW